MQFAIQQDRYRPINTAVPVQLLEGSAFFMKTSPSFGSRGKAGYLLFFLLFLATGPAGAVDITLQWDANVEPDLMGYQVYYKTDSSGPPYTGSGAQQGSSPIRVLANAVCSGATCQFTVNELDEAETYYFAVTAFDASENESDYSNEVFYQPTHEDATIVSMTMTGPVALKESATFGYIAFVRLSDGTDRLVTDLATWSENSPYATFTGGGVLTTAAVPTDQTLTVSATYGVNEADPITVAMDVNIIGHAETTDSDSDGMPDWWENAHGLNPSQDDSGEDLDEDGLANMAEYESETSPGSADTDKDGFPDGSEVYYGFDPTDPDSKPVAPPLEIGEVNIDDKWKRIEFVELFMDPIVVVRSLSHFGDHPAIVRMRNVDRSGFEIRVQEWESLSGTHTTETAGYVVMERGRYTLADGTSVEASRFETGEGTKFGGYTFNGPFEKIPVVLATVCSFNEEDTVTGRLRNITTQGFEFKMQEQELSDKNHAKEMISYIAWEPSWGTIDGLGFEVHRTEDMVTHEPYTIWFNHTFMEIPVFVAAMQTTDGLNPADLRWQDNTADHIEVWVEEEHTFDGESRHTTEVVGYMAFCPLP